MERAHSEFLMPHCCLAITTPGAKQLDQANETMKASIPSLYSAIRFVAYIRQQVKPQCRWTVKNNGGRKFSAVGMLNKVHKSELSSGYQRLVPVQCVSVL